MSIRKYFITLLILLQIYNIVSDEFNEQPQIYTNDGKLIFHAVPNRNITLRVKGEGSIFLNSVNVLNKVKKKRAQLRPAHHEDMLTSESLRSLLTTFQSDLRSLGLRFASLQNRTRGRGQSINLRRNLGRLQRTQDRIARIENIVLKNECEDKSDNGTKCKNGGTCYDGYNDFHCECSNGWTGKTCEEDVDECYLYAGTDLGCQNNGDCINTMGGFSCSCHNGFYGTHCRIRKAVCEESGNGELCGHGTCVYANNDAGYTCICDQGWTKNKVVPEAACNIDINECEETTNPCHSECINLPGSFKCAPCPMGYTGNGLFCADINECSANNGGCSMQPKVSCINSEGSYHCGNCPLGWKGDGKICESTAPESCESKGICYSGAKCEYISNTVVCTCPSGMYGHGFGSSGCSLQSFTDPCTNHTCQNNATCEVVGSGTRCFCEPGFMGPTCDKPDACQSSPCLNGGTCTLLLNNKYRCSCPRGTTGPYCEIVRSICGSIIQQRSGVLSYPPNDGDYLPNERCAWIIRTNIAQILNVTFSRFELEPTTDCNKDWLQLHDGRSLASRLIGRFCGNSLPLGGNIQTSQNALFFWFRSDNETTGAGFNLTWTSMNYTCGGVMALEVGANGIIRSPGYPGNTPPNRECEWRLDAPFGYRFLLRFYEINLGSARENNCTRDKVTIYDSDLLLRSVCEPTLVEPLHSSSNAIRLQFHTDSIGTDSLFQLHYEVLPATPNCGGIFSEPSGEIAGYINGRVCSYLIQQPMGTKINLNFTKIDLLKSEGCYLQKIEIFDGNTDDANLLKRLCGYQENGELVTSSGNVLLIRYEYLLPSFSLPKNFEVKYTRVCNSEFVNTDEGKFTTPNYPHLYYEHMECTFIIRGPANTVVHINFTDFSISKNDARQEVDDASPSLLSNNTSFSDDETFVDVYLSNNNKRRYYEGTFLHLVSEKNVMRIVFHGGTNKQKGRGIRVEYHFERLNCGGILTGDSGQFHHIANTQHMEEDCEWVIEAPPGKHIQLSAHFSHWNLFKCDPGDADIDIYSNDTSTKGQLLMSFCQQTKDINESFHTKTITIILHMRRKIRSLVNLFVNFKAIDNNAGCGGNFTARYGVLKTPSWPGNYDDSMDCTWIISAPIGHQIELVVKNFSVETTSSNCNDDYLEIRNGKSSTSPLIGKFCGNTIPARLPSFTNYMYLHFVSDSYISDKGFYLTWQQTETGCGGKLNSYTGSIHSPHNSDVNAGTISCDWLITVARGSAITVYITVTGDYSNLCNQNVLAVYDGLTANGPQLKFNCTLSAAFQLTTTSNQALITYNFDKSDVENGLQFFIDYETNCNIKLDNLQGVIESPNFPDNYPPNLNCLWDVHGGQNNKFQLIFSHLDIEIRDEICDFDYVDIIDLRNEDVLSNQHLCSKPHRSITTEGNRFQVKFVTDYSEHAKGFRLEYKRIGCGHKLSTNYGVIESPNAPYSINMNCDWYIEVQAGKKIVLNFDEIHIETKGGDCTEDGIIVSDEKNSTSYILKECRIDQVPVTVTSAANHLYIHFYTSSTRSRKYISATYNTRESSCGGTFRGNSGQIKYPSISDVSGINTECVWQIIVDNSYGINLAFDAFNISCSGTFLSVWKPLGDTDQLLQKTCGSILPETRWIQSNRLKVVYKAGADGWGAFAFKFKRACGGYLNDTSGYIKSRWDENCEWKIESADSKIFLNILHLECDCSKQANCTSGLRLMDGNDESKLNEYCDSHQSNIILSTSAVYIYATKIEFKAKYSIVQNSCGGTVTSMRGILTSPYYPQSYPSNVECIWEIVASSGNYIELDIDEMDIVASENCNQDFLEIRQKNELGKIVSLYCSNETVTDKITIFERVWIKFRSVEGNTARGFKLLWNYAHYSELNSRVGSIEAPPLNSIRNKEAYTWRILLPRGSFIYIEFKEYNRGLRLYDGFDDSALEIPIPVSPWQYTSSSNVLYLISNNEELEAFKINWKTVNNSVTQTNLTTGACNNTFVISYINRLNISSPGYPNDYANDLDCEWVIKPEDPTEHIVLSIYDVKLETNGESDYLRVFSSPNLRNWHQELNMFDSRNKSILPIKVVHGTPYLKVVFHSDYSVTNTGFTALARTACGANMTGLTGQILDRRAIRSWSSNTECFWHIEAQTGKRIALNFNFGKRVVPKTQTCRQYAIVYDGFDDNAPILTPGRICNQEGRNVKSIKSSNNRLTIKYNLNWTNPFEMDFDFNLTYQQVGGCETEIQLTHYLTSVNISSPNYPNVPNPHTECNWIIVGPIGEILQAEFIERFSLNTRYCDKEYIEFFDGSTELSHSFGRFCTKPNPIRSTGNILRLHYLTDINEPRNGFLLNVSIANCGGIYTGLIGEISSKGYPGPGAYLKPAICEYTIKMPIPSRIRLNFSDFDLPFDANNLNRSDRIEIFTVRENTETIAVLYGNATVLPILETDYNVVTLRFITFAGSHLHRGFRLKFHRLYGGCYRDVNNESGILTLAPQERAYGYASCRWKITVPKGQRVSFEFEKFESQSVPNNTDRFMMLSPPFLRTTKISFFNDMTMLSKIVEIDANNVTTSEKIVSSDNFMYVRIDINGYLRPIRKLQARYSSNEESPCPKDINEQFAGSVDTSNLPSNTNFFCSLKFGLNGFETITFHIKELQIARNNSMNYPYAIRFVDERLMMPYKTIFRNISDTVVSFSSRGGMLSILQNDVVKIKRFSANFYRHSCGGSFNIFDDFKIVFPPDNFVYNGDGNPVECSWMITGGSESRPYKLIGNFSFINDCNEEYIGVYSFMSADQPQIAKICHNSTELLAGIALKQHVTTILYHSSDYKAGSSSFQIRAESSIACGTKTMVKSNSPTVSINSKNYQNNIECNWEFEAGSGLYMFVEFTGRFFIEKSINCTKDYLQIYTYESDVWQPKERFCGRDVPSKYNATSNRIMIVFRTNNSTTGDGFTFRVSALCLATFNVTDQLQVVQTPDLRSLPYSRFQCGYTFVSNSTNAINLQIKEGSLTYARHSHTTGWPCSLGTFTVYKKDSDGNEIKAGEYCGPIEVTESRYLRLTSNMLYDYFLIAYQLNTCGGNITTYAIIRPLTALNKEGNSYANNMNCVWNIIAPTDYSILVRFKYFEIETHYKCEFDFVAINAGSAPRLDNELVKLCGNLSADPPLVLVDANQAVITAVSDDSNAEKGFMAEVIFVRNCNERIALTNDDSISQPLIMIRNYTVNSFEELHCQIRVTAPESYRVKMQIRNLDINPVECVHKKCGQCNYLEFIEAAQRMDTSISMGKFCTKDEVKKTLVTSNEHALIQFSFIKKGNYTLELVLEIERSICGVSNELVLQRDKNLTIRFPPNNGSTYLSNTHCQWSIKSTTDFQIHFDYLLLQPASPETGKCVDYLRIIQDTEEEAYCGNATGFTKYITASRENENDFTELTFHSDDSVEDKGFKIEISSQQRCNRTYSKLSGLIDFGANGDSNQTCFENIVLPDNYTINLYVLVMNSHYMERNCSTPNFQINDTSVSKTLRTRCISYFYDEHLQTNSSALRIFSRNFDTLNIFYYASKKSSGIGCGGEIHTMRGDISSPSYEHRNFSECRWDINVPEPNRLGLYFRTFDMGSKVNCDLDYVNIVEISSNGEEKVAKSICANQYMNEFVSKTSRIAIISKKSPNFNGNGWTLNFRKLAD